MAREIALKWKPGGGQQDVMVGPLKAGEQVNCTWTTDSKVSSGGKLVFANNDVVNATMTTVFRGQTQKGNLTIAYPFNPLLDPNTAYTATLVLDGDSAGKIRVGLTAKARPRE